MFSEKFKKSLLKQSEMIEKNKTKKNHNEGIAKFLTDFLPIIIFVAIYKMSNSSQPIVQATLWMIIATLIALVFSYFVNKKIAKMPLFSAVILAVFGGLTIFLKDDIFIKLKPTMINLLFAAILLYGYFSKRPLMSYLFGKELKLEEKAWGIMSLRWALFFIFLALLNEIIWRNFSTDFWVNFKLFGIFPISIIFTISQIPFIIKNIKK